MLPFDRAAAGHYARVGAARRSLGRPMAALDALIAATALAAGATCATRDIRAFEGCGLSLVDPWREGIA